MGCKNKLLALSFILLLMGRSGITGASSAQIAVPDYICQAMEALELEDGDIVLRKGRSMISSIIAQTMDDAEGMSHCGIILRMEQQLVVIHSVSGSVSELDGIRKTPLSDFVAEADQHKVLFLRPKPSLDRAVIRTKSMELLNQQVPFDHQFDHTDSAKLYCSELVRDVYLAAGAQDFFTLGKKYGVSYLDFGTFLDSRNFSRLYQSY
jgi:hypothetical protein